MAVAVLAGIAAVAAGRGDPLSPSPRDEPDVLAVEGVLRAEDLERVRLPVGWRGYRMREVDALLDRLADRLRELEAEQLRSEQARGAQEEPRGGAAAG